MMKVFFLLIVFSFLSIGNLIAQCGEPVEMNQVEGTDKVYSYVGEWPQFTGWDEGSEFIKRDIRYNSNDAKLPKKIRKQ